MIIRNNSEIKINNATLYYKEWHEQGILYLEHIFDFRLNKFIILTTCNFSIKYLIVII